MFNYVETMVMILSPFIRQMFSHYSNMYPQLIKDHNVLDPLKNFLRHASSQHSTLSFDCFRNIQFKLNLNIPRWGTDYETVI